MPYPGTQFNPTEGDRPGNPEVTKITYIDQNKVSFVVRIKVENRN